MPWSRTWQTVGTLLCLWVLAANVYVDFRPVRVKILNAPLPTQHAASLPLGRAADIPQPYLVLVYRVRNVGTAPVNISAQVDGQVLHQLSLAPGSSTRVDLAWPRPASMPAMYRLDLAGTTSQWMVEYAELANLHGFTRGGGVEFLILPARQPFASPSPWTLMALAAWVLLLWSREPPRWPRWPRAAHLGLSIAFVLLFVAAALSPVVSSFRVVLAPQTFILGVLVLSAPHTLGLLEACLRWVRHAAMAVPGLVRMAVSTLVRIVVPRLASIGRVVAGLPWLRAVLVLGVAAYALLLWWHVGAYAGGADQSGYLNSARLLAGGRFTTSMRPLPGFPPDTLPPNVYVPLGFRSAGADSLVPIYPLGLPLMIVAISQAVGWEPAADGTMVLHALLGVALVFWLGRACGLPWSVSALGALLLATSPLYLFISLNLMSDTPALVWTTAAVLLAWRSRRQPWWALLAGAALALAVLTRPTNILALAPVAVCLGASTRRWLWLSAGGAPGAALLVLFNLAAYGNAITTGYGDTRSLFGLSNLQSSLWNYAGWLPVLLTPLGLLALGLPGIWRRAPRLVAVLLVWIAVFVCFYAFYFHTHETWWYLRFLLPAFPPLIVGSLWVGRVLLERWGSTKWVPGSRGRRLAGAMLVALILCHNAWWGWELSVLDTGAGERTYAEAPSGPGRICRQTRRSWRCRSAARFSTTRTSRCCGGTSSTGKRCSALKRKPPRDGCRSMPCCSHTRLMIGWSSRGSQARGSRSGPSSM